MSFYRRLKYFLVHSMMMSNKEAQRLIESGTIEIDGNSITENNLLEDTSEIKVNNVIVRPKRELVYFKFHKPKGYESTLNQSIEANISTFFAGFGDLAIAGRLDKMSEGLLLLSNDGKWVEKQCNPKFEKEKEYLVTLNKTADEHFVTVFSQGLQIGRHFTAPCFCELLANDQIRVILKEGKNRQIRKMCKTLGYEVIKLKRIRIDNIRLGEIKTGQVLQINENELFTNN